MIRLLVHELRFQQRLFWRSREVAFFVFLLPLLLLVLTGSVYGDEEIDGVRGSTFLLTGMLGYSVAVVAFASLAITMVVRRESGVLKRVRGTPLPPGVYLGAVIGSTLVIVAVQILLELLAGRFLLDADWPQASGSLLVALLLGVAAFAALGLGLTAFVRSSEGSSALVNAIYLPMAFISGSFFSVEAMPGFLQALAEVLPLTYLLELVRQTSVEGAPVSDSPQAIAVLASWGVLGLAVAVRMFRWEPWSRS